MPLLDEQQDDGSGCNADLTGQGVGRDQPVARHEARDRDCSAGMENCWVQPSQNKTRGVTSEPMIPRQKFSSFLGVSLPFEHVFGTVVHRSRN
jgi:hypothetical protein